MLAFACLGFTNFIDTLEIIELLYGLETRQSNTNGSRLILIIQVSIELFTEVAQLNFTHIFHHFIIRMCHKSFEICTFHLFFLLRMANLLLSIILFYI